MVYETGSIRQIHKRLWDEGYCISVNTIRAWVKQGILPAAFSGKKAYITFSNVVALLKVGTPEPPETPAANMIRRIG